MGWDQIMTYEASGQEARAMSLFDQLKTLKEDGSLEECEDWRRAEAQKMTAQAPPSLGSFDTSELEGKTHDEAMEMAKSAAAHDEHYRACQIMLHAHRSSGAIDSKSTEVSTFSGLMNFVDKLSKKAFTA